MQNQDETGFYYLNSRYYDPQVKRFINADGQINTDSLFVTNLFAYCENDPVNHFDPYGQDWAWVGNITGYVYGKLTSQTRWMMEIYEGGIKNCTYLPTILEQEYNGNFSLYSEHKKKGTTSPSNKNKHEEGQSRKQRNNYGGEKGDKRRTSRSNKRHIEMDDNYTENIFIDILIIGVSVGAIIYLVGNDITLIGIFDDGLVPIFIYEIADRFVKIFA